MPLIICKQIICGVNRLLALAADARLAAADPDLEANEKLLLESVGDIAQSSAKHVQRCIDAGISADDFEHVERFCVAAEEHGRQILLSVIET